MLHQKKSTNDIHEDEKFYIYRRGVNNSPRQNAEISTLCKSFKCQNNVTIALKQKKTIKKQENEVWWI